jgi:putative transposase
MSYALIAAAPPRERARYCRLLGVPPSSYYAWQQRTRAPHAPPRAARDALVLPALRAAHAASRGTYGRPRLTCELRARGVAIGQRRVGRLLREAGLVGGRRGAAQRRWRQARARLGRAARAAAGNVLAREFGVGAVDRAWVCDTTHLPTRRAGMLVLAVVLDLGTRRVLGWAIGSRPTAALTTRALQQALRSGRRPRLHHSDQGNEYIAAPYGDCLAQAGIAVSWSRPRNCWDNAVIESFFATLKTEAMPATGGFDSPEHAYLTLFDYIEIFYNRERRHSSLNFVPPATYEAMLTR